MLTTEEIHEIEKEFEKFPQKRAACIEALRIVQKNRRWIDDQLLKDIAGLLEMTVHELDSVATFYNMIFRRPVGRNIIHVCDSVTCYMMGCNRIIDDIKEALKIDMGETTGDERFTLLSNSCMGLCDKPPAIMINNDVYVNVDVNNLSALLNTYK